MKTITIDGCIGQGDGEISASMIRAELPKDTSQPIAVKIHSEGGSVFEGFAIHDIFAAYPGPKSLSIESSAFSIASFIACAFDDVEISSNGYMMLHNPYAKAEGDDEDFAQQAEMLGKLKDSMVSAYAQRSGKSEDEIKAILKNETYLNAQQSVDMGFAKRISGQPVIGRAFAKMKNMPHGVVTALFGAGSDGENREQTKEKTMSSQPVAATLPEIEAAFPKLKPSTVLACLRRGLPMASVASAAVDEMMAENEELKKQITALSDENAKYKAAMEDDKEPDGDEHAEPDGDEEPKKPDAKAKAKGVKPIAKARTTSGPSASARWETEVEKALVACNGNRSKAVAMANRKNPGLRELYVAEANSK